jgi:NitT/TauT family transport system substrate-binding protein
MRKTGKLGIVLLLLAAACTKTASTTAPSAAPTGQQITIGFSAWPGWFPWQVAEEKGLFTKAGLNVKMQYFESYTDSLNALAAGKIDANSQTTNDTVSSVAAGAKETIVLVNDNSTGNDKIVVKPGINSITDLKGKTVAVEEGAVDHFLLLLGLEKAGMTEKDVHLKPLLTEAAAAAFAAGQADAVGVFAPFTTKALELKGSKALFTSADFPGAIPDHLVVGAPLLNRRADLQKVINVWYETLAWIKSHPDDAVTILAKRAGVTPADYRAYAQGTTIFTVDQNLEAFTPGSDMKHLDYAAKTMTAFLKKSGLIKTDPDLSKLFDPSFVKAYAGK